MSRDDDDDRPAYGPGSFVHLDVRSAYARLSSPTTPLEYATTLACQFPLSDRTPVDEPRSPSPTTDWTPR
jgi:hypothetical protein